MFESLEDLVEASVNLNNDLYPFMNVLIKMLEEKGPEYEVVRNQAHFMHEQLSNFLTRLEASRTDEGGINLDEFDERKIH